MSSKVEHFVTLFDQVFLPQGLALHMSMERHIKNYKLWILCMEDQVFEILAKPLRSVRVFINEDFPTLLLPMKAYSGTCSFGHFFQST